MLGVTFLVFSITRLLPGGPVEKAMQEAAKAGSESGGGGGGGGGGSSLSEDQIEELEREYGYDQPIPVAYLQWLGILPRERLYSNAEFGEGGVEVVGDSLIKEPSSEVLVDLLGTGLQAKVTGKKVSRQIRMKEWVMGEKEGDEGKAKKVDRSTEIWEVASARVIENGKLGAELSTLGWEVRIESVHHRKVRWSLRNKKGVESAPESYDARGVVYKHRFSGVFQGDFGRSTEFGDPVIELIANRIPIAFYFGLLTAIISYGVCLPLGVVKAIKHRTAIDNITSILIFVGYAIPGFALGAVLLVSLGANMGWFPMIGLVSSDFDTMDNWGKVKDLAHHTVLPLTCYVVSSFAWLTMIMKNSLMDNLAADYVRTAVAKGVGFRQAVFRHAFRNSFIPVATSLGSLITIFVGGSILIETVFDIQGFGLLQFKAIQGTDQFVIMGTLVIAAFLMIMGNILSDIIVAFVDPRIKFQ